MGKISYLNTEVRVTVNTSEAVSGLQQMANSIEKLRDKAEELKAQGLDVGDNEKEFNRLAKEIKTMEDALKRASQEVVNVGEVVANLENQSLKKLRAALRKVKEEMNRLDPEKLAQENKNYREELAKLQSQYVAIENQIDSLTGVTRKQTKEIDNQGNAWAKTVKRLSVYIATYGGFNAAVGALRNVFTRNLEFSDQLADIRKTTGLSTQSVNELSEAIMKIDSRQSVQQLHDLAHQAGKLGLGSQGVEGVLGFVKAADKLGVALREDLGDDAIIQLTKMADVMGLTKKLGVEKSLTSIGSAINELSMASTASADFMVNYSQRLSGIAAQAHLTTDELLGFAAAADATGQEVEVSATAMNKFVVQLQTHYKTVAQAAGINEESLHEMLTMGKTADAVVTVLDALGKKGGLSMLAPLMKDMGSDGARLTASLATMATNIDLVKQQLEISKEAFEDNISVLNEYNIKNETAAAIMERMRNSWDKMFTNSSNSDMVKELALDLYELSKAVQENSAFINTLKFSLIALVESIKMLLQMTPWLATGFLFKGLLALPGLIKSSLLPALKQLHLAIYGTGVAANTANAATIRWTAGLKGLFAALKSNIFIFAASMLVTFIYKLREVATELTLAEKNLQSFNEGVKDFEKTSHAAGIEANILFNRLKEADKGSKERRKLMTQINEQYGKYLPNLLTEKSSLEEIATAQETVNTKLRQALALKAKNQAMDEAGQMFTPKMAEATSRLQEIYTGAKIGGVGENDIQFLIKRTQQLYDAGEDYATIKEKVWKELYHTDWQSGIMGRSATLMQAKRADGAPDQGLLRSQMGDMQEAVNQYIANFWNQNKAIERAAQKYDPLIGNYTEKIEDGAPYTIVEAEDDKKKRAALKAAKDEYKAIMAAIEVFYKQQEQVVNDNYLKKKITTTQREQEIADIQDRFRRSRIAADEALLDRPGAHTAWNQELQRMEKENISLTEDTTKALDNLWSKNLKSIGDKLRKFGDGEMDGIWKNFETDKTKIQEQAIKLAQEVEKIINQYDFEAQVTEKFIAAMQKLNIFFPQLTANMKEGSEKAMEGLHSIYPKLFSIDINTDEGLASFRKLLQEAGGLGEQMLTLEGEKLQLLYYKTLEYGDAMVEAQKKTRDRNQKIADEIWKQMGGKERETGYDRKGSQIKETTSLFSRVGLASENVATDMEVELYRSRMEAALEYRDVVVQTGGDIEDANAKVQESIDALSNVLVEKTMTQLETLKSFMDPLEDMGEGLGEALALDDAAERADALSEVMWNAADAVADATKEMIVNWVKQKIQHAIVKKAMEAQEAAHQAKKATIVAAGEATETSIVQAGETAKATAVEASEATITTTKAVHSGENVAIQATETTADAALGIAQGSAKTIGELGWWGIPLVAVISALIGGLLSWALGQVKGSKGVSSAKTTPKLVTGMLTYDSGNVQSVLGSDGNVYSARVGGVNGSGIVSVPTLTNVNGQAALVGEQGPEIVIGRATTRALMQNNPGLLAGLVQFDKMYSGRGFRTYAGGNVQQYGVNGEPLSPEEQERQQVERIMSVVTATLLPTLEGIDRSLAASNRTNAALHERLKQPINATINKYGRGGLVDEVATGLEQEKKSGRNDTVRRLFGSR